MTENGFAPLAERPPFDVDPEAWEEEGQDDGPSPAVAEVLSICAQAGLDYGDHLELALCCIAEVAADLSDGLSSEEVAADPVIVAALERLAIAAQILAGVDLGEDVDDGEAEGEEQGAEAEEEPV